MPVIPSLSPKRIAIVGNHLPRQCGIATFTTDLADALDAEIGERGTVFVLAMDDTPEGYRYPERVRFQLRDRVVSDYVVAADFIAANQANAVIIQHEYGIYGGPHGAHVLRLMRELRVPILVTLHTVLKQPSPEQRQIIEQMSRMVSRFVVISRRAEDLLAEVYGVPRSQAAYIPHGIPDVPFVDPNFYKDQFKAEGRRVILTFGLLSPNKGIEFMIEAMSTIARRHPDALYIVLGATHPHLRRQQGEAYRTSLQRRVADLGLTEHVRFRNRFVAIDELCAYIGAADIYVTPYLGEEQISSGTLAYAVGAGKAVVSTPYWYARELLAEGRGLLVPFRDPAALAGAVNHLLDNDLERHQMRKRAYTHCRDMIWKQVARDYLMLVQTVVEERQRQPRPLTPARRRVGRAEELPEPDLRHLKAMTDGTGILQHCLYTTPDRRHGYAVEDQGHGLIVCALHDQLCQTGEVDALARTYLAFLLHASDRQSGQFRGRADYFGGWDPQPAADEEHGRALWGLCAMAAHAANPSLRAASVQLVLEAMPAAESYTSARAMACALLGLHSYLERYGGDAAVRRLRLVLAERLYAMFQGQVSDDWQWCEPALGVANAAVAHALILAGTWIPHGDMRDQGMRTLEWLCRVQRSPRGHFSLVGTRGGYPRGQTRALFDQTPLEAMHLCLACAEAFRATNEDRWLAESRLALEWFLGRNDLAAPLYDFSSGGCCDALTPDGPNANQGARAQLSWLIALLTFLNQVGRQPLGEGQEAPQPAGEARMETASG